MDDYIKEAEGQLNDKDNYHILPQDSKLGNNKLVNLVSDRLKIVKLIINKTADKLQTSDPRTLRFYIAPKIHKPGNPGCSIVRSVKYHTANISKYVDYQLQIPVKQTPSYIKDTDRSFHKLN